MRVCLFVLSCCVGSYVFVARRLCFSPFAMCGMCCRLLTSTKSTCQLFLSRFAGRNFEPATLKGMKKMAAEKQAQKAQHQQSDDEHAEEDEEESKANSLDRRKPTTSSPLLEVEASPPLEVLPLLSSSSKLFRYNASTSSRSSTSKIVTTQRDATESAIALAQHAGQSPAMARAARGARNTPHRRATRLAARASAPRRPRPT